MAHASRPNQQRGNRPSLGVAVLPAFWNAGLSFHRGCLGKFLRAAHLVETSGAFVRPISNCVTVRKAIVSAGVLSFSRQRMAPAAKTVPATARIQAPAFSMEFPLGPQ
jgi:hypothetical protein